MAENVTVEYRGPAPFVSALAQMLRQEGVEVTYEPPQEERGTAADLLAGVGGVVVNIACAGAYDAIKAGVQRFRASRFGKAAQVDVEDGDGDGDDKAT
jgi:hypothetical protein